MNEKISDLVIRPVAHWFINCYMRELRLTRLQQFWLSKLLLMTEGREVFLKKKKLPKEVIEKMGSIGFKGDLDKTYVIFHSVMNRNENVRADYTLWLDSVMPLEKRYLHEKIHVVHATSSYISKLFAKALDVLWAYKKLREKHSK